jgi:tetratricopeptide (TPR) repeat protein
MLTPLQATNDAYTALRSGDLDRAEWLARQVLERNGNDVGMLKLLGAIHAGRMDWQEALVHYVAAIEVLDTDFEAWNNAGVVWQKLGRLDEARRYVNRAIVLNPEYAQAFFNLGNVAALQGEPEIAQGAYQKAIVLDPEHAPSYRNLGRLLAAGGDLESAAGLFRQVLKRTPDSADAHLNLGNALQSLGNFEQALAQYNRAIEICPYDARLAHNLGSLYGEMGDREAAKLYYLLALKLNGKSAASHHQLGKILQAEGQVQLAIAHLQQAVSFAEGDAAAWRTLGLLWGETGALEGSVACLERAIALVPDFAEAHVDLGRVLLALGLWARGWQALEWRWESQDYLARQLPQYRKIERWDGSPLAGRSLLVWSEGDRATVMQFARFLPRLNPASVTVQCEDSLATWMAAVPGVSQVIAKGDPVKVDLQISIGSLPAMLKAADDGAVLVGPELGLAGEAIDWLKLWA